MYVSQIYFWETNQQLVSFLDSRIIRYWKIKMKGGREIKRLLQQEHMETDFFWHLRISYSLSVLDWTDTPEPRDMREKLVLISLYSYCIWNSAMSNDP